MVELDAGPGIEKLPRWPPTKPRGGNGWRCALRLDAAERLAARVNAAMIAEFAAEAQHP